MKEPRRGWVWRLGRAEKLSCQQLAGWGEVGWGRGRGERGPQQRAVLAPGRWAGCRCAEMQKGGKEERAVDCVLAGLPPKGWAAPGMENMRAGKTLRLAAAGRSGAAAAQGGWGRGAGAQARAWCAPGIRQGGRQPWGGCRRARLRSISAGGQAAGVVAGPRKGVLSSRLTQRVAVCAGGQGSGGGQEGQTQAMVSPAAAGKGRTASSS